MSLPTNPLNRKEQYLNAIATGNTVDMPTKPITREEAYLDAIAKNGGGGGGGTTNYNALDNKPQIAGTTLQGNKTLNDLGIASAEALGNKVDKEAGKGLSTNDYDNTEKGKVTANAEAIEATQGMISDAYDSTHTYNVGDYCIYNDTLYKCNTAIVTGEAFTPAKWDALTVADAIVNNTNLINGLLSSFANGIGTFKYLGLVEGTAYNKAFEDIVNTCYAGTYQTTQVFIGLHASSGIRLVFGYLYADKAYGCNLEISYGGLYATFLFNGTYTRVSIPTT